MRVFDPRPSFRRIWLVAMAVAVMAAFQPAWAETETVRLPITLDYPFIRSIFLHQVYTDEDRSAVVVDEDEGCTRIVLREPEIGLGLGPSGPVLEVVTRIQVRAGLVVFGDCFQPVDWAGYIRVLQEVWLDEKRWRLRFRTIDSQLLDQRRQPTTISELAWSLVKDNVHDYLDRVSIDLAPPVGEIEGLLPLLFAPERREEVERWLASLRPGKISLDEQAVRVGLLMDVDKPPAKPEAEPEPSEAEIARFVEAWQVWDAFLVNQIMSLGGQPLSENERRAIMAVLLETRYGLLAALEERTTGPDLVRRQFMSAWNELSPILRRYLVREPSGSLISYLAYFTASDALAALDKLGPTLGLDISRDGLIRLARLLDRGGAAPLLEYSWAVNPDLRTLLGLGPPLAESGPVFEGDELDLAAPEEQSGLQAVWDRLVPSAWASGSKTTDLERLRRWLPPGPADFEPYLDRVRGLLERSMVRALDSGKLDPGRHPLYRLIVPATAWQESCWRQFKVVKNKIRYLRSYNRTSVGLMQINERVWRGVYKRESLRWDIDYNARAGAEILELYLRRYALGRMDPARPLDDDTLAQVVYAMYNGGPKQFYRFLKRKGRGRLYLSDRLFLEKYEWVKAGRYQRAAECLLGR